jgi:hypothetical protein
MRSCQAVIFKVREVSDWRLSLGSAAVEYSSMVENIGLELSE